MGPYFVAVVSLLFFHFLSLKHLFRWKNFLGLVFDCKYTVKSLRVKIGSRPLSTLITIKYSDVYFKRVKSVTESHGIAFIFSYVQSHSKKSKSIRSLRIKRVDKFLLIRFEVIRTGHHYFKSFIHRYFHIFLTYLFTLNIVKFQRDTLKALNVSIPFFFLPPRLSLRISFLTLHLSTTQSDILLCPDTSKCL